MYCYCKCSLALLHGAVGWSAVCDCGISLSYSLTFLLHGVIKIQLLFIISLFFLTAESRITLEQVAGLGWWRRPLMATLNFKKVLFSNPP